MTNKKRIAICISGQIRTSGEKLEEIAEKAREVDADIFISVWKERGGKTIESGPKHISFAQLFGLDSANFFPRNWIIDFEKEFPNWREILPVRHQVTKAELSEIFPDAIIEIEADKPELDLPQEKNSLRMLYKIHRCNRLKQEYEKAQGFKYDRVIRVRPDMLVDFTALAGAEIADDDLLIFLRRENSLHDKYWAGSSRTDDTMSSMYQFSREHRLDNWVGIHKELTNFVDDQKLNPVNIRCVLSDFSEFGDYTAKEKLIILERFIIQLESGDNPTQPRPDPDPEFFEIAKNILKQACRYAKASDKSRLDPKIVAQLEARLENATRMDSGWMLLPILSFAIACDPSISISDRTKLAFGALLHDALTWKTWLEYRTKITVRLIPDCAAELLPYFENPDQLADISSDAPIAGRLLVLLQQRISEFDPSDIIQAQKDISHALLAKNENCIALFNFFKNENRPKELLSFGHLLVKMFPDRNNVRTLLAQTKRVANELEAQNSDV